MAPQVEGIGVETIETHKGPIEIGRRGVGPPVLFVHGTPGGADSSLAMGWFLAEAGFEVIAPSRPGYLGTPLAGREEIDQQAHLLSALLDALGHERAGVVSWSGGGPSGLSPLGTPSGTGQRLGSVCRRQQDVPPAESQCV